MVTRSRFLLPRILPHGSSLQDAKINRRCKDRWRVSGALSAPANFIAPSSRGAECCILRYSRAAVVEPYDEHDPCEPPR